MTCEADNCGSSFLTGNPTDWPAITHDTVS
jgi:hypothetical protein